MAHTERPQKDGGILIVEDDPVIVFMFQNLTSAYQVDTEVFKAVKTANARIRVCENAYKGAIVDIALPDGTGFSVVAEIKKRWPEMPVIVCTSLNDPYNLQLIKEAGCHYLYKGHIPWKGAELIRRIMTGIECVDEIDL